MIHPSGPCPCAGGRLNTCSSEDDDLGDRSDQRNVQIHQSMRMLPDNLSEPGIGCMATMADVIQEVCDHDQGGENASGERCRDGQALHQQLEYKRSTARCSPCELTMLVAASGTCSCLIDLPLSSLVMNGTPNPIRLLPYGAYFSHSHEARRTAFR